MAPPRNTSDEKKTDLGRTVYGGGGIEPDIKVDPLSFFTLEFFTPAQGRMFTGISMFVRELINGETQTPGVRDQRHRI